MKTYEQARREQRVKELLAGLDGHKLNRSRERPVKSEAELREYAEAEITASAYLAASNAEYLQKLKGIEP